MKSGYRNIAFTVEPKENNSLSFLDTNIFRDAGNYKLQFLEYTHLVVFKLSFLPISLKYNLISTLLHRGFMIGSSYRALQDEILKLKHIF